MKLRLFALFTFALAASLLSGCHRMAEPKGKFVALPVQKVHPKMLRQRDYALSDHRGGRPAYDPVSTVVHNSIYR